MSKILAKLVAKIEIILRGITGLKAVIVLVIGFAGTICTITLFVGAPIIYRMLVIIWIPILIAIVGLRLVMHDRPKKHRTRVIKEKIRM